MKNVPPAVAEADTAVVVAADMVVVEAVDTAAVAADMVVAEAVAAPAALVATAADIAKTLPTVLRVGVEIVSTPIFFFSLPRTFYSQLLPNSKSATIS